MPGENNLQGEIIQDIELNDTELDEVSGGTKNLLKPMDTNQLQRLMEQKGQLESMISNTMKANSESQAGLASNLKA